MKVLIVGGVAGGATAAARLRRLDERAEIIVFEKTGYVSYANCGLPYYIGGVIEDSRDLTLQSPEGFQKRFRVDVRVRQEVTQIDSARKTVTVHDLTNDEIYTESYDKLILSPGALPLKPNMPGLESEKLFTLRTVEDTLKIRAFVDSKRPAGAVIVGGGYIGIETAENLVKRGVEVTIVQRSEQLMNTLDFDMASLVHNTLRQNGVKLLLNRNVTGFREENGKIRVCFDDGDSLSADMALLAIGVAPDARLSAGAGLRTGLKGSFAVNDRMQTSDPDIYAVGDAVQIENFITKRNGLIALAGPANKQGRVAADNIAGLNSRYIGTMGSSIIQVFDVAAACTGLTERAAKEAGLDCESIVLHPSSHADYYPGASTMTLKIVFEKKTFRLLGAQIVGTDGVDKRLDVLATAIHFGAAAAELKDLELAYAPPFSSAKDPVNMAGFVAENIQRGLMKQFHWNEVEALPRDGSVILLDTRTRREYAGGHAEGFVNIPVDELRERLDEIEQGKPVYVMCQSGLRSYLSCRILSQSGRDCYNFSGGYRFYSAVVREQKLSSRSYPCGMDKT